ncbi:MAG: hypothetical protein AABX72_00055 [Nanoarchaeota archaeon]
MVKVYFDAYEPIVQKTLEYVAELSASAPVAEERPVVVGGMAIQLYAFNQRPLLRPTSDVDILDVKNRAYEIFSQGIGVEAARYFKKSGYQVQPKRARDENELKIMKGQNAHAEELFFAHFTRYTPEMLELTGHVSIREAKNAREMSLPYNSSKTVKVKLIEDMIPYKIRRVRRSLEALTKSGEAEEPLHQALLQSADNAEWESLIGINLPQWCENLTLMQADLQKEVNGSVTKKTKYKLNKDLYDLCLLSEVILNNPSLFNRAYYLSAKREVEAMARLTSISLGSWKPTPGERLSIDYINISDPIREGATEDPYQIKIKGTTTTPVIFSSQTPLREEERRKLEAKLAENEQEQANMDLTQTTVRSILGEEWRMKRPRE